MYIRKYIKDVETNIENWIKDNLSDEEYLEFKQAQLANGQLWTEYKDQEKIIISNYYESYYIPEFDTTFQILVGEKINLAPGITPADIPMDSNYAAICNKIPTELRTIGFQITI